MLKTALHAPQASPVSQLQKPRASPPQTTDILRLPISVFTNPSRGRTIAARLSEGCPMPRATSIAEAIENYIAQSSMTIFSLEEQAPVIAKIADTVLKALKAGRTLLT